MSQGVCVSPVSDRLLPRIEGVAPDDRGCLIWPGALNHNGYGVIADQGRRVNLLVHRVVYQLQRGEITEGLEPDHLCRVRACFNPDHIELVDHRTNILRGETRPAENSRKTHCLRGHEFTASNTMLRKNGRQRQCRTCVNDAQRRRHDLLKVSQNAPDRDHRQV